MTTLPEYFGAAYLVNLPQRVDRLRSAREQLARVRWRLGPGAVELFAAYSFDDRAGFPNAAMRGCFHSHLECIRRAQRDNRRGVMILEDDIALTSSLPNLTPTIVSRLDSMAWDFIFFGHEATGDMPCADAGTRAGELKFEPWAGEILGAHFYGINGRILPRLIAHLERLANGAEGDHAAGPMPLDGALNVFRRENPDVRCIVVRPKLGWQRPSRSDIAPKAIDTIAVVRPVIAAMRELKHFATRWRW